jgi:hypothetical protein
LYVHLIPRMYYLLLILFVLITSFLYQHLSVFFVLFCSALLLIGLDTVL